MEITIKTTSSEKIITCTKEQAIEVMKALGDWEGGNLRIKPAGGDREVIINHRHFVEAFANYEPTIQPE